MAEVLAMVPARSVRRLCPLLGLSRSWWYERTQPRAPDLEALARRDAIERIVLEFPSYG